MKLDAKVVIVGLVILYVLFKSQDREKPVRQEVVAAKEQEESNSGLIIFFSILGVLLLCVLIYAGYKVMRGGGGGDDDILTRFGDPWDARTRLPVSSYGDIDEGGAAALADLAETIIESNLAQSVAAPSVYTNPDAVAAALSSPRTIAGSVAGSVRSGRSYAPSFQSAASRTGSGRLAVM